MKLILRIFNFIYIAIAAVACVCLFVKPLASITATINFPKEEITNLIYPALQEQISEEDFSKALEKSLTDGNLSVPLNLEVPATSVITKDSTAITTSLTEQISVTVDEIVSKLEPTIVELAKEIAKKAGKDAIKESIATQIKNSNPESDANQIMENCGINDEYIEGMTENVLDLLLGNEEKGIPQAETVSDLMDGITDNIKDVCNKLSAAGVEGYPSDETELQNKIDLMSDDIEEQLKTSLQEANLADEAGNLVDANEVLDNFIISFLDQLLGNENEEEAPESKAGIIKRSSEEEEESKLKAKIREVLNKKVEDLKLNEIVEKYSFVPLIFTLVLILPWAIFILLTLIRTLRRSKCWTKSWIIFSFAAVQLTLGIVLYLATTKFIGQIAGVVPLPDNPVVNVLKTSSLSIKTSSFIPSILYIIMIPLSIVYVILSIKVKRDYKKGKLQK